MTGRFFTHRILLFFAAIFFFVFNSCKKEEFETGSIKLGFSEDTIIFDTVFTTVGSSTQLFTVYNDGDNPVKTSIRVAGGENSNFRLNVDGMPGKSFTDVEIGAEDSIFIFVEVTVDPNSGTTPLVVTDSIVFSGNGFMKDVKLVAWGQDAYFHRAPQGSTIAPFFLVNCNETWLKDKPHVVYGYALVDSACTLTIEAGANVHFHPGSGMIVLNSGTLLVNGTQSEKVTFQGDRLGEEFKDIPGQWDRIWFSNLNLRTNISSPGSKNSVIKNAIIKNGYIGLLVDTAFDGNPNTITLHLENTIVKNMAVHSVALRGSNVNAYNCVFSNSGAQSANILYGGNYKFYHCTFANFWTSAQRQDPALSLNNYFTTDAATVVRPMNAYFGNCIVYGNNENEILLDSANFGNQFGFKFDHALLKVEGSFPTSDPSRFIDVLRATNGSNNPHFTDVGNNVYDLDSASSAAIDAGDYNLILGISELNNDIRNTGRPLGANPDLGAYERR